MISWRLRDSSDQSETFHMHFRRVKKDKVIFNQRNEAWLKARQNLKLLSAVPSELQPYI